MEATEITAKDRVYVYPSHGLGEASKLDGRPARVLTRNGDRLAVRLVNGDPRSIFCRTQDGVLYLDVDEVSRDRR